MPRQTRTVLGLFVSVGFVVVGCNPQPVDVTGGPGQDSTAEFEQAEAVASLGKSEAGNDVVTVAFNDRTQGEVPKIIYPDGTSGTHRTVYHGASLMGWSYSTNNGVTFTYGGPRVAPPTGS